MALTADDLKTSVSSVLTTVWDVTDGYVVPIPEDIAFQGGGRRLAVAMLYSDLADSTALVTADKQMAAKIFKAFISICSQIIRNEGGHVRSFDGDRVMGVFVGDSKNSSATKAALKINWAFKEVLKPKFEAGYTKLRDGSLKLDHSTGVDSGDVLVVRAGLHGNNDLLWIGRAANIAAKLSDIRHSPYRSFISKAVYDVLNKESKFGADGKNMWTEFDPYLDIGNFYGSSWHWSS